MGGFTNLRSGHLYAASLIKKKLKFYSSSKNQTKYSEFINHIRNREHKRIASKFRIGNHNALIRNRNWKIYNSQNS